LVLKGSHLLAPVIPALALAFTKGEFPRRADMFISGKPVTFLSIILLWYLDYRASKHHLTVLLCSADRVSAQRENVIWAVTENWTLIRRMYVNIPCRVASLSYVLTNVGLQYQAASSRGCHGACSSDVFVGRPPATAVRTYSFIVSRYGSCVW